MKLDNPLFSEWKSRYESLPVNTRKEIDSLSLKNPKDYQLKVIKRTKKPISSGDVFILCPRIGIYFYGKVLQDHILHINNDTFVNGKNVIFIFRCKSTQPTMDNFNPNYNELLIQPAIVDESYWHRGFFYTISNKPITEEELRLDYGFYAINIMSGYYCKANGELLAQRPKILGTFGITTITGIASQIEKEFIINPDIVK